MVSNSGLVLILIPIWFNFSYKFQESTELITNVDNFCYALNQKQTDDIPKYHFLSKEEPYLK